jgi:hypothetical protein
LGGGLGGGPLVIHRAKVKAEANPDGKYLQSWAQKELSRISFGTSRTPSAYLVRSWPGVYRLRWCVDVGLLQ